MAKMLSGSLCWLTSGLCMSGLPPALGRPPVPGRPCVLASNQDKMNPLREGERSPVGSTHLPGNRCPGPRAPIVVSHPQNTSPLINHSGEPVSFSCSDESDPFRVGAQAKSLSHLRAPHFPPAYCKGAGQNHQGPPQATALDHSSLAGGPGHTADCLFHRPPSPHVDLGPGFTF